MKSENLHQPFEIRDQSESLVARNITMFLPEHVDEYSEDRSINILQYIQANIYK